MNCSSFKPVSFEFIFDLEDDTLTEALSVRTFFHNQYSLLLIPLLLLSDEE